MKKSEKEELVVQLFSKKKLFERKVLNVKSSVDRLEIITILVQKFIRDLLKSELNFLYMHDMKQFRFSLIINLLFKEVANEWLSYAHEILQYSRDEALLEIQDKKRVAFIYSVVQGYFLEYKKYFFEEIVNTFFELGETVLSNKSNNQLIEYILRSNIIKNNGIAIIQSYSQLLSRIKSAKDYKSESLSKIQVKIAEAPESLEYEKKKKTLELSSLDNFDAALKRLKETMIESMSQMKIV